MGRSESATASIGIKIALSDLILQINENNFELIKEMLFAGFIEHPHRNYSRYTDITYNLEYDDDLKNLNHEIIKKYLIKKFKNSYPNGRYFKEEECLFNQTLLIPLKKIFETNRFGWNRIGKNAEYRKIDFDLSLNIDKYKEIDKKEIVFILCQDAG